MADREQQALILRGPGGRFLPGQRPGPGRPKGTPNKFPARFLADAHAVWETHGRAALEKLAETDPAAYVHVMAAVAMHTRPRARPIYVDPEQDSMVIEDAPDSPGG
ncbi:hypothetical protein ACD578_10570 [Microvirga sp. RSM25]|uniref:hypothetical protein n=1 Tax=Microvirga sp. RSM25 TaxID=3273802 RepID=UPI00384C29F2